MKPISGSSWQVTPGFELADATLSGHDGSQLGVVFLSETMARVTWRPQLGLSLIHI